ncbi:hypothetical protein U9M48_003631 [Paspalum notatum var. saurae]|uniref:Uncharacterized protein n=1 Tax=Paspalum notatum var. saurae TaxID=547442 RepID=A0AAQ3SE61_PASNO
MFHQTQFSTPRGRPLRSVLAEVEQPWHQHVRDNYNIVILIWEPPSIIISATQMNMDTMEYPYGPTTNTEFELEPFDKLVELEEANISSNYHLS